MWKVEIVQPISDPGMDGPAWGFNITNEAGRPIISFIYATRNDAEAAATHAQAVIYKAIMVRPPG
jgi:hypothetical protein